MNFTLNYNFLNNKVARRVTSLFLLSALLPIAVTAGLSYTYVTHQLVTNSQTQLRQTSKHYGIGLLDKITFIKNRLRNISISLQPGQIRAQDYRKHFNQELKSLAYISNSDEVEMLFGEYLNLPLDLIKNNSKNQSKIIIQNENNQAATLFLLLKLDSNSKTNNILIAEIDPNYLWGKRESLPYATSICVIQEKKEVLFCSDKISKSLLNSLNKPDTRTTPLYFEWQDKKSEYIAATWDLFLQSRFSSKNWTIVSSQTEDQALLPISTFNNMFPLIIIISLLITSLLSISQIRRSLVPLESLISGIRRVANNDFSKKVRVESNDEFQELASSFNTMTRQISKQFNALKTLSQIDQLILSNPELEHIIATILKRLHGIVTTDFVSVTIIDSNSDEKAQSYFNKRTDKLNPTAEIEKTVFAKECTALLLQHQDYTYIETSNNTFKFLNHLTTRGIQYAGVFPIILENKLTAVINLGFNEIKNISTDDIKQVRDIADRFAVALATTARDEKLYQQAHYDALTKLPNRELFSDRLRQEIIRAKRDKSQLALLFIDLDRFKHVNDTQGHSVGDILLQKTAQRLKTCVRDTDTVARLGGDEFTLIISNINETKDASIIAENTIKTIAEPYIINGHEIFINASIGIAVYPIDGDSVEQILINSDAAMYRAKEQGRGQYQFFEEKMNADNLERTQMEQDLRFALERDEFTLCYQPQINLVSGEIIGAEALLRWNHPIRGSVAPDEFIPIAEDTGLIESIGEWVLLTACQQFVDWQMKNIKLRNMAVNVSIRQFIQKDFLDMINKILVSTNMSASNLELEITESVLMEDRIDTISILNQLSQLGISLSIDDFGTGYSSLSYLKRLPVDSLKIDRSFMEGIPTDEDAIAISASIIALAHTLNKKVIAEGVETVEQLALLRSKNCDIGQGFFFNKPISAELFELYFTQKSTHLRVIS